LSTAPRPATRGHSSGSPRALPYGPMQVREIMTSRVVTAGLDADVLKVARLMRDHNVGSVVLCDPEGEPTAMITDRDLALRALADDRPSSEPAREHASRPLVTGEPDMDLEEAAALMVQHQVRRLPIVDGDHLAGIVTLDDIAVRTGNLEVAKRMTQEVIEGALPGFFFHERG
jgi:CBS domain-containing protein